jgi:hypothetical protein
MADRVLASYETPGYREQQAQTLGNVIGMAVQAYRRRQDEKRAQDLAAINQFLDLAAKRPEMAAGQYGQEILKRYGQRYPEIVPLVGALSEPGKRIQEMEGAGKKWLSKADELWNEINARKTEIANQDSWVPGAWGVPYPNVAKMKAMAEMSNVDPNQVYLGAAQKLKPSERYAAQGWAKSQQGEFPDIGMGWIADPSKMPPELQALMGVEGTSDPTRVRDDWRALRGLAPRTGVQEETTFRTDEALREMREREKELRKTHAEASDLRVREEKLRHGHNIDEEAAKHAHVMAQVAARQADDGDADSSKALSAKVLKWQGGSLTEYDNRLKTTLSGEPGGEKGTQSKIKKAFLDANGMRPRRLNPAQGKQIERETAALVKAGIVAPEEAESFALLAASRFNAISAREPRKETQAALNQALMEEAIGRSLTAQGVPEAEMPEAHGRVRARFFDLRKRGLGRQEALQQAVTVPYEEVKAVSNAGRALAGRRWSTAKPAGVEPARPAAKALAVDEATARRELEGRVRAAMKGKSEEEIAAAVDSALEIWRAERPE